MTSPSTKPSRLDALLARQSTLQATISALTLERDELVSQTLNTNSNTQQSTSLTNDSTQLSTSTISNDSDASAVDVALDHANAKIKAHIKQLQAYNEIKDIGTQLMGMIAEKRGVRIIEVQQEFGVDDKD